MPPRVRLTNETLNCYGTWLVTAGGDISQFLRNPILLYMHRRGTVIGLVEDIKVEGDEITGVLKFDEATDLSRQTKQQYECGSLRMVSVGIDIIELSDAPELLKPGQTMRINTSDYSTELMELNTPSEVLLWMNGKLDFKQHALFRITDIIETLYDVDFVYEDESLKEECFTGQFATDDTPEAVLNVLKYTGKFSYRKEGKVIYIYRN